MRQFEAAGFEGFNIKAGQRRLSFLGEIPRRLKELKRSDCFDFVQLFAAGLTFSLGAKSHHAAAGSLKIAVKLFGNLVPLYDRIRFA
jgi:hypothetical protein